MISNPLKEARAFRAALAEAPEPELGWDLFGSRRRLHRLWWLLLREHNRPARLGAAVLVGVLIGCSPFFGLHIVLCLIFAVLLRLNKLAVWAASNVSLPIFAPFVFLGGIQLGHLTLRGTLADFDLDTARGAVDLPLAELYQLLLSWLGIWVVGGLLEGLLLGGLLGALTWRWALRRESHRS